MKQKSTGSSPLFCSGSGARGAWTRKYAAAISPAQMNAARCVKRPSRMSVPPTISITLAAPSREASGTVAPVAEAGIARSFCVPCSRYREATTIRRTLRSWGDQALSTMVPPWRVEEKDTARTLRCGRVAEHRMVELNRTRILAGALIGLVAGLVALGLGQTPLFETGERRTL